MKLHGKIFNLPGKMLIGLAAASALALGASAVASGANGVSGHAPSKRAVGNSAPTAKVVTPKVIGDNTNEDTFTPVTPCRIVDTRPIGPILAGQVRSFHVRGATGFPGQGGHTGGCNIPDDAVAASLTITSLNASGTGGVLRAYASGTPKPTTVFTAIDRPLTLSSGGSVGLCVPAASCAGNALTVAADFASADVLIDVTGYYRAPIYAFVFSDGTLSSHSPRVLSATKLFTGEYQVDTDRNVSTCSYQVTPYVGTVTVLAEPRSGAPNSVYVQTMTAAGALTDSYFYLTVTC
ncbi:MAG: hypothetical protein ACR2F6_07030 [Mycobacteriales bacterium]